MLIVIAQVLSPFVAPALAWAGVAMVSVPVAIHLLSRWRRKPQPWGAMRFLLEAYRKQKQRMRFEQWLLLLVRCLIVLLLGLALARPLMVGALGDVLGGLDSRGRVVNLVIDDAMSLRGDDVVSQLTGAGSADTRFGRLISQADAVLDSLNPGDRVTLWRSGRPARAVIGEPSPDYSRVREALKQLEPGYSRPDMPDALSGLYEATQAGNETLTPTVTFLFSDFARSSSYIDKPVDLGQSTEAQSRAWVVSRPQPPQVNVQVADISPRRNVVWLNSASGERVSAQVRVTRYAEDLSQASHGLTVELIDAEGRSLATIRREVGFTNGQQTVTLGVDLPLPAVSTWLDANSGTLLSLRAQLDDDPGDLLADNLAYAAVEVRRRMRVALVDEPASVGASQTGAPTPGQWVRLALNPTLGAGAGPIEVVPMSPTQLNSEDALRSVDAVVLMRPDRLIRPNWSVLEAYVGGGGLLWVFTPAAEGSSPWVTLMADSFETGWRIGLESLDAGRGDASWALAGGPLNAEPLERLAADWQALTQPLRVYRMLAVETEPADAWLSVALAQGASSSENMAEGKQHTLLAHRRIGRGSLLLLSTAVEPQWTNLPTKPLFVPLIHETLNGVLGARELPGVAGAVSGDAPMLDDAWRGVASLTRLGSADDKAATVDLKTLEQGFAPAGPLSLPGVYQANTDDGPRRLIVNPDARGGDTRAIDEEALVRWLDGLGDWQWLNEQDPGSALRESAETADIGWALLWVVLGLVLIETMLARYFSHANAASGESLTGHVWRAAIRLRSGNKSAEREKGRAA